MCDFVHKAVVAWTDKTLPPSLLPNALAAVPNAIKPAPVLTFPGFARGQMLFLGSAYNAYFACCRVGAMAAACRGRAIP